ncbi:MAG TPA: hypothetical protein VII78_06250 [Myxococcota bacterium]|jgi:hypothetical protein
MARGLAEVLGAYLDAKPPPAPLRTLFVPVSGRAQVAASVALGVLRELSASGLRLRVEACDPGAGALCGDLLRWRGEAAPQLLVQVATSSRSPRPDYVLAVLDASAREAGPSAGWLAPDAGIPVGIIELGGAPFARAPESGEVARAPQRLATVPEADALRTALGLEPASLRRVAAVVARWLSASDATRSPGLCEPPGAFSPVQERT